MKKQQKKILAVAVLIIFAGMYLGNFFAPYLPSPLSTWGQVTGGAGYKTITVTGSFDDANPSTTLGAVGTAIFWSTSGGIAGSGALTASGAFSISLPSGADYKLEFVPTGGNAVNYFPAFFSVSIPAYPTTSEVTTYALAPAFIVYPKAIAWSEQLTFGVSGSASVSYTANAWGGTQTYTATGTNIYTVIAATTYTVTFTLTCTTAYSQLGWDGSLPGYEATGPVSPLLVFWTNRTDWSVSIPGSGNAQKIIGINSTAYIFLVTIPVIRSNTNPASVTVQFTLQAGSAGQGQWGANYIQNSTVARISATGDYKTNAPTGYGVVFYGARMAIGHCG